MRLRLLLSFVLVVIVSVASVVLLARQRAATEVRSFMYRGGMVDLGQLASELEAYYRQQGSWQGVESLLPGAKMGGHGQGQGGPQTQMGSMMRQRLRLADVSGRVLVDTGNLAGAQLTMAEQADAIPLKSGLRTVGYLLAEGSTGYSNAEERFLVSRLSQAALTAGLLSAGVSLLLALLLSYFLLQPVRQMTRAAEQLGGGDLSARVTVKGQDELARLGRTFNSMATSLQKAEDSRRLMTADIAHELRNPLAVQRASLEALQDGVYPLTAENLQPILDQNLLLTRLVDDLRTLALADAGQLQLDRTPADLVELAQRVLERFKPQAAGQQVTFSFQPPAQACPALQIDPLRIDQVISNLLSNALRYTPAGGHIKMEIAALPAGCTLTLQDSGPGIPEEALPYIFERFFRADRSRSRQEGGTGLGLAIARQLAEAHGGSLSAANHPQGGAVFTLVLPTGAKP